VKTRCFAFMIGALLMLGCTRNTDKRAYEYMPDMARNTAYRSYSPNPVTKDGLTLMHPPGGTIARGYQPFHYGPGTAEAVRAGIELRNPFPSTVQVLGEGKVLFTTFCQVCHGMRGQGDGPLVPRIPNPPSYTSQRVLDMPAGRIFHVITEGSGRMPSYAAQLETNERWKVVAYVQFLQRSQETSR
jgi:mono/diheme cytochrome c family protein